MAHLVRMESFLVAILFLVAFSVWVAQSAVHETVSDQESSGFRRRRSTVELKGGPEDVAWIVQLSDLHFSVHHPDRAEDFKNIVGPALAMINPSLVLITGDLTDGKSKDLLTMKQDEREWMEYKNVMDEVIKSSGLSKSIFYDLRGNHDNFGVPALGDSSDFFSNYSISAQMKRDELVNSVTIKTSRRSLRFVGFDSTSSLGLRGPTNLFGHPTDELLKAISTELSLWESQSAEPVVKISFGHFPLSFSAASSSGKTLKDVFLTHSLSAYLCGHLHTRFGKNLKRHHTSSNNQLYSRELFQWNPNKLLSEASYNWSNGAQAIDDFWEWEMGDWRKSRSMRILAIDRGCISFLDVDFKMEAKKTIIVPTFPLDSRFLPVAIHSSKCQSINHAVHGIDAIRALVFSSSPIVSVVARIYDSSPGSLIVVMEASMRKHTDSFSRGDLYSAPWNFKAFEDPSPERFLLQIEATDIRGRVTLTALRPFSVDGTSAMLSWNWKEFLVMGCQWAALYFPIFWSFYLCVFCIFFAPKIMFSCLRKKYTLKNFLANKGVLSCAGWILEEFYSIPQAWCYMLGYLLYLLLCPWVLGQALDAGEERGYMTYRGWVLRLNRIRKIEFYGFPDIMVVVLPHLFFVILPSVLVIASFAAERGVYRDYIHALSGKKEDDHDWNKLSKLSSQGINSRLKPLPRRRWIRYILLMISISICWKHFKNCIALMKAYEMNPLIHFPVYSLSMPLLLMYTIYRTRAAS